MFKPQNIDLSKTDASNLDVPNYSKYPNIEIMENWGALLEMPEHEVIELSNKWLEVKSDNTEIQKLNADFWAKTLKQHGRKLDFGKMNEDGEFALNPAVKAHLSKLLPKKIADMILENPPKYPLKRRLIGNINGVGYEFEHEIPTLHDLYKEVKKYY